MLAFMAVLWLTGMAVAMVAGFVGIGALWGERRWALLVVSGVILSASIYLLFVKGFGIPLPRGVIGDWLLLRHGHGCVLRPAWPSSSTPTCWR